MENFFVEIEDVCSKTSETFTARSPSNFEIPNTPSSTPVIETPTDHSTTPQLTPDTPVSIREELPTVNDADQSQGPSTSTGYTTHSGHVVKPPSKYKDFTNY